MSERFFRSNGPGYPLPVSSELENSGIRVAVSDCSVTERRQWHTPYQTSKTVHVHAKHYKHNEDERKAPGVCGIGSIPLSHSKNVVTRIGIHITQGLSRAPSLHEKAGDNTEKIFKIQNNSFFQVVNNRAMKQNLSFSPIKIYLNALVCA